MIEIQILDPQLQTSLIRMPVPLQKLGEQTMLAFQETEERTTSSVSTTGKRRLRSSDLLKPGQIRHSTLP